MWLFVPEFSLSLNHAEVGGCSIGIMSIWFWLNSALTEQILPHSFLIGYYFTKQAVSQKIRAIHEEQRAPIKTQSFRTTPKQWSRSVCFQLFAGCALKEVFDKPSIEQSILNNHFWEINFPIYSLAKTLRLFLLKAFSKLHSHYSLMKTGFENYKWHQ